jgi:putative oxidoreductase
MHKIILWAPPLLARLVTGVLFFDSGLGKIRNLDKFIGDFVGWGLPAPRFMAPFVAWSEFIFGALLIIGLFSRLSALAMLMNMMVAILTVKLKDIHTIGDFLYMPEVLLVALLFWIMIAGGGAISVDSLRCSKT